MSALERWLSGALVLAGLLVLAALGVRAYGVHEFSAGRAAAIAERKAADDKAVRERTEKNAAEAARQAKTNTTITKEKDDEIAALRARLAATGRLRVGAAVCPDRPAGPAETEGAGGGDRADPPGGLVSAAADRDFKQLIADVETDLATGRACQAFVRENGLVP